MQFGRALATDLRLELYSRGVTCPRLTASGPKLAGVAAVKYSTDAFNYDYIVDLSKQVYDRIEKLITDAGLVFTLDVFRDVELAEVLSSLNAMLYGQNFPREGKTLGDIVTGVIQGRQEPPTIVINGDLGVIPWELTSPTLQDGPEHMLANLAYFCVNFDLRPGEHEDPRRPVRDSLGWGRASKTFDKAIKIKAGANLNLAGASDEVNFLKNPGGISTGSVAPEIKNVSDVVSFFQSFGELGFEIVHFLTHCEDDPSGFRLEVSDSWMLPCQTFLSHRARFPDNAFHFLNVCKGAPTPRSNGRSLVDFMNTQHRAGGVVASLVTVRSLAAAAMAKAFYEFFLPKSETEVALPASVAIFEARQKLARQGQAAGYLYRAYGRPDLYMVSYQKRYDLRDAAHA